MTAEDGKYCLAHSEHDVRIEHLEKNVVDLEEGMKSMNRLLIATLTSTILSLGILIIRGLL